jgi:adenine-specific DNA-methyltransferase
MSAKRAQYLRKVATPAERKLWSRLKNRKAAGIKFRRQHPIDDYVLDFFCVEASLAIELDGSGHRRHFTETADLDREITLHEKGVRVIRFTNRAVLQNIDGVVNEIIYFVDPERSLWASQDTPPENPKPSPQSSPIGRGRITRPVAL